MPEDDKWLSTFLAYERAIETFYLFGERFHHPFGLNNQYFEKMLVNLAKQRLNEGFQFIGITNRWEESVCLFFSKFIKPGDESGTERSCRPEVFEPINTASSHRSAFNFTKEDLKYFDSYDDEIDRETYNHALRLFEADLLRYGVTRDACISRGCWPEADTK